MEDKFYYEQGTGNKGGGAAMNTYAVVSNAIVLMTLLQPQYHKYRRSPRETLLQEEANKDASENLSIMSLNYPLTCLKLIS